MEGRFEKEEATEERREEDPRSRSRRGALQEWCEVANTKRGEDGRDRGDEERMTGRGGEEEEEKGGKGDARRKKGRSKEELGGREGRERAGRKERAARAIED